MKHASRYCLAAIAGLAWSLSATAADVTTERAAGATREPAPLARSASPERIESDGRSTLLEGPGYETRMVVGDLRFGDEPDWADDVLVGDPTYDEVEPAMVAMPDGTLLVAVEQYGPYDGWVRIYRSDDGGETWAWLVSFMSGTASRNPSITFAQRVSGEQWAYLAYEATMADATKRIIVVRFDPDDTGNYDFALVATGITSTPDIYPRVATDNRIYDVFYVYVTYIVNGIDANLTMFARSLDYGLTYSAPVDITGGSENSSFASRPDIAYGSAGLFVAFEKPGWTGSSWQTQVWVRRSTNYGASWSAPAQLTVSENGAWHPSVAAAVGASTVMVAFTQSDGSQSDIFCTCSTDGGDSYASASPLPRTFDNEKGVALTVSASGGRYHAAFWRNYDIVYTSTDAASPLPWADAIPINEANWASSAYSRPAIVVDPTWPTSSETGVAWTDYRGAFYDIYFDRVLFPTIFADDFESGDLSRWA